MPRSLELVVLRGLERDRERRWRDLEELRRALLPFAPGRLLPGRPGLRLAAYLIDVAIFLPAGILNDLVLESDSGLSLVTKALLSAMIQVGFIALSCGRFWKELKRPGIKSEAEVTLVPLVSTPFVSSVQGLCACATFSA